MKRVTLAAVLALSSLFAASAFAQTSRADVKSDAAKGTRSGEIQKSESEAATGRATDTKSMKARPAVKAETAAATKAGETAKGEATQPKSDVAKMTPEEAKAARAKRKAETAAANKAGQIKTGEK